MSQQKVIEQVLKLLAVADCEGAEEGEKKNAKLMAEKLMLKHDLSVSDVQEEAADFESLEFDTGKINNVKNRYQLANIVAKFNGVYMVRYDGWQSKWSGTKKNSKYIYTGRKQDIVNTMYMFDILMAQATAECKVASKKFKAKYGRVFNIRENLSFYLGFNVGIHEKLDALKEVVVNEKQKAGLVPVSVFDQLREQAEKMARDKDPKIKTSKGRGSRINTNVYNDGTTAGQNASLTRGVASKGKGTLRLS